MRTMWDRSCEREAQARELARKLALGQAPVDDDRQVQAHVAGCASCQETMAVAAWMQELASAPVAGPLPDPTYLWWKAEMLRRWDAGQRAAAPVEVGERVQVSVSLVSAAALLIWLWRDLPGLTASATSFMTSASLMLLSGALLAATAVFMVRDLIRGR